jgi:hypothetical protein
MLSFTSPSSQVILWPRRMVFVVLFWMHSRGTYPTFLEVALFLIFITVGTNSLLVALNMRSLISNGRPDIIPLSVSSRLGHKTTFSGTQVSYTTEDHDYNPHDMLAAAESGIISSHRYGELVSQRVGGCFGKGMHASSSSLFSGCRRPF